jgi:hypothetical protein
MYDIIIADSWTHPWEGFSSSFKNCTQDEIDWVSSAYLNATTETDWPPAGSISWHLNHVGACKQSYAWQINNPSRENGEPDWFVCRKKDELLLSLDRVHAEFMNACGSCDQSAIIMGKGGHSFPQFIGIVMRHEIWHGGQIALIRRMYSHRVPSLRDT